METLEEFNALRLGVGPELQTVLYGLFSTEPDAAKQRMIEIAAGQGVTLTIEKVHSFLRQMDDDDEFDNIELDPRTLFAIPCAQSGSVRRC